MDEKHWYVIRITHNRTKSVYDKILALHLPDIEVYCPSLINSTFTIEGQKIVQNASAAKPLLSGFLFVNTTIAGYENLLNMDISGLTPYYDHFHTNKQGRNLYLVIPDKEFENFRLYCQSKDIHKLVDQKEVPSFLNGKLVRIISGPFRGVEGTMLRWHSTRRVFITIGDLGTFGTGFIRACDFEIISQ